MHSVESTQKLNAMEGVRKQCTLSGMLSKINTLLFIVRIYDVIIKDFFFEGVYNDVKNKSVI